MLHNHRPEEVFCAAAHNPWTLNILIEHMRPHVKITEKAMVSVLEDLPLISADHTMHMLFDHGREEVARVAAQSALDVTINYPSLHERHIRAERYRDFPAGRAGHTSGMLNFLIGEYGTQVKIPEPVLEHVVGNVVFAPQMLAQLVKYRKKEVVTAARIVEAALKNSLHWPRLLSILYDQKRDISDQCVDLVADRVARTIQEPRYERVITPQMILFAAQTSGGWRALLFLLKQDFLEIRVTNEAADVARYLLRAAARDVGRQGLLRALESYRLTWSALPSIEDYRSQDDSRPHIAREHDWYSRQDSEWHHSEWGDWVSSDINPALDHQWSDIRDRARIFKHDLETVDNPEMAYHGWKEVVRMFRIATMPSWGKRDRKGTVAACEEELRTFNLVRTYKNDEARSLTWKAQNRPWELK